MKLHLFRQDLQDLMDYFSWYIHILSILLILSEHVSYTQLSFLFVQTGRFTASGWADTRNPTPETFALTN